MQEEIFWRKEEISLLFSPLIFRKTSYFTKKRKKIIFMANCKKITVKTEKNR